MKMWLQENLLAVGVFGLCTALVQVRSDQPAGALPQGAKFLRDGHLSGGDLCYLRGRWPPWAPVPWPAVL